jgi:hypothetical protein
MLKAYWLFFPLLLQGAVTVTDEIASHHKRGLPRWERIGHPLDTATVLACMLWVLWIPPGDSALRVYLAMAVFSCAFVTKDEWVHQRHCPAAEHWIHAVLFALHPLVLIGVGLLWPAVHGSSPLPGWIRYSGWERSALQTIFATALVFGAYQAVYWNLLWRPTSRDSR